MSGYEVYAFLAQNQNIAFTSKELNKRVKITEVRRKLNALVKTRMVKKKNGIVDYQKHSNAKVIYYYVGDPVFYIPMPKKLIA
jgi:transcription initiation factor IIE alpha subunit